MATRTWHPRGEARWPDWRRAEPGVTRVRHVRSGETGTFVRWPRTAPRRSPGYAVIRWDRRMQPDAVGRVVAYAFDLEPI